METQSTNVGLPTQAAPAPTGASRRAVTVARRGGEGGAVSAFARTRRPGTILRSTLAVAGFVAVALGTLSLGAPSVAGATPATAQEPPIDQCLDPQVCPIPYVRLSTQETEPFMFVGKVVDVNHPRYEDYESAINRFPDVRSCLADGEREKPQPDLRQIDWGVIRNIRDIDVCVFRIASSIEDISSIKSWLQYHNFDVGEVRRGPSKNYLPQFETDPIFYLESHLSVERFRQIIPQSWFARLVGFELVRNYWLAISFSQTGQVVEVSSGGNSKLN